MIRWLKFNFVGGIGIGVQLAVLTALKSGLHFNYLLATALAVEAAVIHNFLWHERFTWKDREKTTSPTERFMKFNLTNGLLSIVGNLLLMKSLAGFLRLNYIASNLIAITICSLANFLVSDKFVFQRKMGFKSNSVETRRSITAALLIFCCLPVNAAGASDKNAGKTFPQIFNEVSRQYDEIWAKERRATLEFINLPPQERIKRWGKTRYRNDMDNALTAQGTDAIPYLVEIVHMNKQDSSDAVSVLCSMDRFVPASDMVIPEVANTYIQPTGLRGVENPFMKVDGRRIGKLGYDAVQWAATQTKDQRLRLYARYCSGLLRDDFKSLSLAEQVETWRKWTIDCNYVTLCWGKPELETKIGLLEEILAEEAPDSIPLLVNLVENDINGFVRDGAIGVFREIDSSRMRLRGTELGRHALEVSLRTLDPANPKRLYPIGFLRPGFWRHDELELRQASWEFLRTLMADDNQTVGTETDLTIMYFAFRHFYGEELPAEFHSNDQVFVGTPELKAFVAYLTQTDPYFPSWNYFFTDSMKNGATVLHPDFRKRVERYHRAWVTFQSSRHPANTEVVTVQ